MVVIHGTRKFLERVGPPDGAGISSTTKLGAWYATALFWRPQVALFVNETTLLPAFVRLAPAAGVVARFGAVLGDLLAEQGCSRSFIEQELKEMEHYVLDKTRSRSVLGVMNEFASLAHYHLESQGGVDLLSFRCHWQRRRAARSTRLTSAPIGLWRRSPGPSRSLLSNQGLSARDFVARG